MEKTQADNISGVKTDDEINASEARYRRLFETAKDGILILDANTWKIIDVNPFLLNMLGYSHDEFIGKELWEIGLFRDITANKLAFKKLQKDKYIRYENLPLKTKDGHQAEVEFVSNIYEVNSHRVIQCNIRDITDRKIVKNELRQSHEKYKGVFNSIRDAIMVTNTDWTIIDLNPAFASLFGYTIEDFKGEKTVYLFGNEEEYNELRNELKDHLDKDNFLKIINFKKKQGEIFSGETSVHYLKDGAGNVIGFISLIRDITERMSAQKALKESNERLLIILEGIDSNVYAADINTHEILFMNKSMKDSFGSNLTGQICYRAFRNQTVPCSFCTNSRIINEQGMPKGSVTWEDQNPITGRWYINCDRAIQWVDGHTVRLQVATDITSSKEMENQRIELNRRMLQAQKMEAIGILAGGIAHDFNNILSAIVGYSELALMTTPKSDDAYGNIQEVLAASGRATELVKQIITFARQKETEIKPIRVKLILKEALKLMMASIPSNIEIREIIESDGNVLADATQIHQVVMNLCTNAAQAMEDRGGLLTVRLKEVILNMNFTDNHPTIIPGNYMQLHVEDTGYGIRPDFLGKIFDPYFTTKRIGEGTGLGLSLVKGIVDELKGLITVSSKLGSGSIFDVYIPVLERKANAITPTSTEKVAPTGDERILFIDDENPIAEIGEKILKSLGYHVTVVTNPIEALELFKSDPRRFDLVITDMTMPKMTGDLLAVELHKIRPDVPLILCTGFSKKVSEERASNFGIKALLMKPILKMELAQTVRKVLDKVKKVL